MALYPDPRIDLMFKRIVGAPKRILSLPLVVSLLVLGCNDTGTGPNSGPPLQFVSGNLATDTIEAILPRPLVVVVRDSFGAIVPAGTQVRFTVMSPSDVLGIPPWTPSSYEALVRGTTDVHFNIIAVATTDAAGRAAVTVKLGTRAGTVHVIVDVPTWGLADTTQFTVKAGAASGIGITPADTALYTGKTYQLRGGVTDRFGNVREDPVTWSGSGIDVGATGVVTTTTLGRYTLTARFQGQTGTAALSVVPQGQLAAARGLAIVTFNLDGSNLDTVTTIYAGQRSQPQWIPNTNQILYTGYSGQSRLYITDLSGTVRSFLDPVPATILDQSEAMPDRTGTWVYFGAFDTNCAGYNLRCLYRAAINGSGAQLFRDRQEQSGTMFSPSPSPDGSKVAFVTEESATDSYSLIRILNVTSNTLEGPPTYGVNPSWSPDGSRIAYLSSFDGSLMVMHADGTQSRMVTSPPKTYSRQPLTWSPDSQWVLLRGAAYLEVVNVQTGAIIPLPYSSEIESADWR